MSIHQLVVICSDVPRLPLALRMTKLPDTWIMVISFAGLPIALAPLAYISYQGTGSGDDTYEKQG